MKILFLRAGFSIKINLHVDGQTENVIRWFKKQKNILAEKKNNITNKIESLKVRLRRTYSKWQLILKSELESGVDVWKEEVEKIPSFYQLLHLPFLRIKLIWYSSKKKRRISNDFDYANANAWEKPGFPPSITYQWRSSQFKLNIFNRNWIQREILAKTTRKNNHGHP